MNAVSRYLRELYAAAVGGWNRFWFTPSDVATLAMIRILGGAMLFYTHLVWSTDLESFFGPNGWVNTAAANQSYLLPPVAPNTPPVLNRYAWSYFWWIDSPQNYSPTLLWGVHIAALVVFALLTLGLFSRTMAVLAFVATVSYVNRVPGALFGLDQINGMLALYLMLGPCGAAYSLDRLWARQRAGHPLPLAAPSTSANIAIRLIQLHMCVIYFFAGLSKAEGIHWWHGDALWGAFANLEYQSLDMTWLVHYPLVIALMSHVTIFWELSFCVLVWPRLLRPIVLLVAIPLHVGIGACMGMWTFGLVMLIGCSSFIPPEVMRDTLRWFRRLDGAGEPVAEASRGEAVHRATNLRGNRVRGH